MSEPILTSNYLAPMRTALEAAAHAGRAGEVPVGAVLLDRAGETVAVDHNRREELTDPTAHAELLVLSRRARELGDWRLDGHTLVVTLEPCPMCAGAAVWARLDRIVYGAADPKAGAAWSLYNIPQDRRLNHRIELVDGVLAAESGRLLEEFFAARR
jgi:tRNA(adenine34) deaminase